MESIKESRRTTTSAFFQTGGLAVMVPLHSMSVHMMSAVCSGWSYVENFRIAAEF
jgi:hypothetical protein